jgi:hypothetical protein
MKITKEIEDAVVSMYKIIPSLSKIVSNLGVSESSVCKILKRNNLRKVLPPENLEGKKFGKLLVLKYVGHRHHKREYECLCDCGNKKLIVGLDFTSGVTKSCGCYHSERMKTLNLTHGLTTLLNGKRNPIYSMWRAAKTRSEKSGTPFTIKVTDIPQIPEYCPVFPWIKLEVSKNGGPIDHSPSLDRIVPELGYIPGNIDVISHRANTIKSTGTIKEHQCVIDYINKYESNNE